MRVIRVPAEVHVYTHGGSIYIRARGYTYAVTYRNFGLTWALRVLRAGENASRQPRQRVPGCPGAPSCEGEGEKGNASQREIRARLSRAARIFPEQRTVRESLRFLFQRAAAASA